MREVLWAVRGAPTAVWRAASAGVQCSLSSAQAATVQSVVPVLQAADRVRAVVAASATAPDSVRWFLDAATPVLAELERWVGSAETRFSRQGAAPPQSDAIGCRG